MQDDMEFSPEQENSVEHNQDNDSQEEDEDQSMEFNGDSALSNTKFPFDCT